MQHTREELKELQAMPLASKIALTEERIRDWYICNGGDVYVSFSGGKDSTVLADIARRMYPDIPLVFADTGLEYPEIRQFVKGYSGMEVVRPQKYDRRQRKYVPLTFLEVVRDYGYPLIGKEVASVIAGARMGQETRLKRLNGTLTKKGSDEKSDYCCEKYLPLLDAPFKISHICCDKIKKGPFGLYEKQAERVPMTAVMACESKIRVQKWLQHGCNAFEGKRPKSNPMAFWTEQDVLRYIKAFDLPIAPVYGQIEYAELPDVMRLEEFAGESVVPAAEKLRCTGCQRTGCMFCAFGAHLEKGEGRFVRIKRTHPKQYEYCMAGGEWARDENGKQWWQPNKKGLGMTYVFDWVNGIYGKDFLRY